jgi:hypothetical protein
MSVTTLKELLDVWSIRKREDSYLSKSDDEFFSKYGISIPEKSDFIFDLFPKPWWGNIKNPKIIVLSINPKFSGHEDYEIDKKYLDNLEKNIQGRSSLNWFNMDNTIGCKWWYDTFKNIIEDDDIETEKIFKNTGFFELFPYHSKKFRSGDYKNMKNFIKKEFGIEKLLPTQKALYNHVNDLLASEDKPLVIILWGQKFWREEVENLNAIDYIDTVSTSSHSLSYNNLRPIDYKRIISKLQES